MSVPDRGGKGEGVSASLLSRNAKLVLAYIFLNSIPIGYMNVVPLVYLIQIGYHPSTVSVIYATSAISNTIGLTPFGILADKFGRKKFLIIGSVIPAVSYVIFGLTLDPYWLIVASSIGGVGLAGGLAVAMSGPPLLPVIADTVTTQNRTRIFGAVQAAWTISLTVGAVLSLIPGFFETYFGIGDTIAHSLSYYIMASIIVVSILPLFFVQERLKTSVNGTRPRATVQSHDQSETYTSHENAGNELLGRSSWRRLRSGFVSGKQIMRFTIVYALSGLGLGVSVQLVATWYTLSFHTTESVAGLWIGLAELVSASSIVFIPGLVRKWGTLRAAVLTGIISAFFLLGMPFSNLFLVAALLFAVRSIFINISWPILQSYIMGVVDEGERAAATGIATTAWGITNSIGIVFGGVLFSAGLLSIPFVIGFLGYFGSAIALWYLFRGIRPPEEISFAGAD